MKPTSLLLASLGLLLASSTMYSQTLSPAALQSQVQQQIPQLDQIYLKLHQAPELSRHEEKTSAFLADQLRKLGYQVTDHIGVYEDGGKAFGIVGVMKNGDGPTVLYRTDMDALPVTEATGLPYASTVHAKNTENQDVGVMQACGHDLHMSVFLGVAKELAENKKAWHGTVELVGQPSEELGAGAKAMLADHLYDRIPKPTFILDEHDLNAYAAGTIAMNTGPVMASNDSAFITFHGIGSHGSAPATGKDPIIMGAEFVMMVQTVVSRQTAAQSPAVITVGTFHAGTKNNIIGDDATLGLSIRSYDQAVRANLLAGVKRTAEAVAVAYGVAADRMPSITFSQALDPTVSDPALTERLKKVAANAIGAENVKTFVPIMASEDVGYFTLGGQIPMTMFALGAADPAKLAEAEKTGKPLPNLHSAYFAPLYEPAIQAGVRSTTAMALSLLQ